MSRTITRPAALATHADALAARSNELSIALNAALTDRAPVDDALARLRALVPDVRHVRSLVDGAEPPRDKRAAGRFGYGDDEDDEDERARLRDGFVGRVARVWETSERVGGKVRRLDGRVGRVREAVDRLGQVVEFKVSLRRSSHSLQRETLLEARCPQAHPIDPIFPQNALQAMREAIPTQDWETATRACKRAMDIPDAVTSGAFAARVIVSPFPPALDLSALSRSPLSASQRPQTPRHRPRNSPRFARPCSTRFRPNSAPPPRRATSKGRVASSGCSP